MLAVSVFVLLQECGEVFVFDVQVFTGVDEKCILTCAKAFDPEAVSLMLLPVEMTN